MLLQRLMYSHMHLLAYICLKIVIIKRLESIARNWSCILAEMYFALMQWIVSNAILWSYSVWGLLPFCAGAEVAVLCITKGGEVLNYQAFTNSKGIYTVAETMPESNRWVSCLARSISSFHEHCSRPGGSPSGVKFHYTHPSGYARTVRPFLYKPADLPLYCMWNFNV